MAKCSRLTDKYFYKKKIKKEIQESFNNIKSNQASNNFNFYSGKYGSFQSFLNLYLKGYFAKFMKKKLRNKKNK